MKLIPIILFLLFCNILYSQNPTSGIVACYPFNGNANDMSGNNNHGLVTGATLSTDRYGNSNSSYQFTGTNSYIDCGNVLNNVFTGNQFTISLWIMPFTNMSNNIFFAKDADIGGCGEFEYQFICRVYNNTLNFTYYGDPGGGPYRMVSVTSPLPALNVWYHVVITYDGTINTNNGLDRVKMYVNCTQKPTQFVYSNGIIGNIGNATAHLGIGNYLNSSGSPCLNSTAFNGKIDDIILYNRSLSSLEVSILCNIINISNLPISINANPSNTICPGFPVTLVATGANNYTWSNGSTSNSITISPLTTTTYTVTGSKSDCIYDSTGTSSFTVNVLPTYTINATPVSNSICNGVNDTINVTGATSYSWSPAVLQSFNMGAQVVVNPTSTTVYTVTGTNAQGCTSTTTTTINVSSNNFPINAIPVSNTICNGGNATINVTGATSYSWSPAVSQSFNSGAQVIVNPISTTVYTITGTNAQGCTSTTTTTINVGSNNFPITVIPVSGIICNGENDTINVTGATSYTWSPPVLQSFNFGAQVVVSPTSTTVYSVTATNPQGCSSTATTTISVNSFPINAIPASNTICNGGNDTINVSGATSYSWSPPVLQSFNFGAQVIVNPTSTTVYTVTGTNTQGCTATTTVTINVNSVNFPIFATPLSDTICNGGNTTILAAGANSYTWSPAVFQSINSGAQVVVNPTNTTEYTVTGTNAQGCTSTTTALINVTSSGSSNVIAYSDATINPGTTIQLMATGASNYYWAPPMGLSCTSCQYPNANPLITTTYFVTGYDLNGCTSYDTIKITVEEDCGDIFIPTAFSPNEDNNNDLLFVRGNCIETMDFKIFDRWGENVFSTNDKNIGWNGKYKSKDLNTQVLYYQLDAVLFNKTKVSKKGSISLIR